MVDLAQLEDAKRRGAEAVTTRGGGSEGIIAWAGGAGIDVVDWVRFIREIRADGVRYASAPAAAYLVHGLHREEFAEGLGLALDALAAHAFQTGWVAATMYADIPAVKS